MTVAWIGAGDPLWAAAETNAGEAGVPFGLDARASWLKGLHKRDGRLLVLTDATGGYAGSVLLEANGSRALPGHDLLRVRRFGHGLPEAAWVAAIAALKQVAKAGRTLRLNVEVFSPAHRAEIGRLLESEGFRQTPASSYRQTLTMDLSPTEAEMLSTRGSLRKRLRETEKMGAVVKVLGPAYADRLSELQQLAMQRSGGSFRMQDWRRVLEYSEAFPRYSRAVGLFLSAEQTQPGDLIGFAWGCMHGDHAEYRAAGTAQLATRVPISYPLLWDLVLWAKGGGATWFDLGGVTVASGDGDPLAGISEFKRNFSKTLEEVGDEWMLEPNPMRAALAAKIGQAMEFARGAMRKAPPANAA